MTKRSGILNRARHLLLLCLTLAAAANASESPLRDAGDPSNIRLAGTEEAGERRVYIVQLAAPAAAEYQAAVTSTLVKPVDPDGRRVRFDKGSAFVEAYATELRDTQQRVLAQAGPGTEQIYSYVYGLNGFAAALTPAQADKIESDPLVLNVWEDEVRPLATNFSRDFLGLFDSDVGMRGSLVLNG